jgi:hypothetical protein
MLLRPAEERALRISENRIGAGLRSPRDRSASRRDLSASNAGRSQQRRSGICDLRRGSSLGSKPPGAISRNRAYVSGTSGCRQAAGEDRKQSMGKACVSGSGRKCSSSRGASGGRRNRPSSDGGKVGHGDYGAKGHRVSVCIRGPTSRDRTGQRTESPARGKCDALWSSVA